MLKAAKVKKQIPLRLYSLLREFRMKNYPIQKAIEVGSESPTILKALSRWDPLEVSHHCFLNCSLQGTTIAGNPQF